MSVWASEAKFGLELDMHSTRNKLDMHSIDVNKLDMHPTSGIDVARSATRF